MESPNIVLTEILQLLKKKRSDLLESDAFKLRLKDCLDNHLNYTVDISDSVIREIHALMSKTHSHYHVWEFIVKSNKHPLPSEIGRQLPKQGEFYFNRLIADSNQNLDVYFSAADVSKEARSRLCIRLFISPNYSRDDLLAYFDRYGKESPMRLLKHRTPHPDTKYAVFTKEEITYLTDEWDETLSSESKRKKRKQLKRPTYRDERDREQRKIDGKQ